MVGAPVLRCLPGHRAWEQRKLSCCKLSASTTHAGGACRRLLPGCQRLLAPNSTMQCGIAEVQSATAPWSQTWHHRLHAGPELRLQRSSSGAPPRPRPSAGAGQTPRSAPPPLSTGGGAAPPAEAPSFPSRDQPQTGMPSRDPQPGRITGHNHPLAPDPACPPAVEQSPASSAAASTPQEQPTALRLQRSAAEPSSADNGSQQLSGLAAWPSVAPSEAAMALSAPPGPSTPFATQANGHTAGQPPRQMDAEDRYASGVTRQGWFEGTTRDFGGTPR